MKIFYLAHDLDDPAILRRADQLKRGGARASLAGFRRRSTLGSRPDDVVVEFGRTVDGRFFQRALSILATAGRIAAWGPSARGNDIIIARGLEMLVLGALLHRTYGRRKPLVYECLDIHRLMGGSGIVGRALRSIEGRLLRCCSLLITSSPAFIAHHFVPSHGNLPPVLLWENKVLAAELEHEVPVRRPASKPPWRIGWFGIIRCERSLDLLKALCRALPGTVEVEIRGRPTKELLPKIEAAIALTPGLTFSGSYDRSRDLPQMYGKVHFTWAIDFFEDGANSAWLLPNRLYEGAAHAAIPIALSSVETGRWLSCRGFGVLLGRSVRDDLVTFFTSIDPGKYRALAEDLAAVERHAFVQPDDELIDVVKRLSRLPVNCAPVNMDTKQ